MLRTDQSEDILCAEFPDEPKWMGGAEVLYYHEILPKIASVIVVYINILFMVIFMDSGSPFEVEYSFVKNIRPQVYS